MPVLLYYHVILSNQFLCKRGIILLLIRWSCMSFSLTFSASWVFDNITPGWLDTNMLDYVYMAFYEASIVSTPTCNYTLYIQNCLKMNHYVFAIYIIPWQSHEASSWIKNLNLNLIFKNVHVIYCQFHDWWWPGDLRSQGIISHDIDQVLWAYSVSPQKRLTFAFWGQKYLSEVVSEVVT